MQFIYVFDEASRDELLKAGFVMLKADEASGCYVFAYDRKTTYCDGIEYILSNTLTF